MRLQALCPSPAFWRISYISLGSDRIILHLEPRRRKARCPTCGAANSRVHSRYRRHAWDLPWATWPVQLEVCVRRLFCETPECPRRTFSEPFPHVLPRHGRRTERASQALLELSHTSSAEAAAKVARLLGFLVSPDTLIRLQRRETFETPCPQALGVDEFALRRRHSYGTLLVDLLRHRPVDLLEGKDAHGFAVWLRSHPGVAVLARDRADAYAQASTTAAAEALQVADRFHLVRNVLDALDSLLRSRPLIIPKTTQADVDSDEASPARPALGVVGGREPTPLKQARWQAVQDWRDQGLSIRAIARAVGMDRRTVRTYLDRGGPPVYQRPKRPGKIGPYLNYLRRRWVEGCHNAQRLYHELVERGYQGSQSTVRVTVGPWRGRARPPPTQRAPPLRRLLFCRSSRLGQEERRLLERVLEANAALALGYRLKEDFLYIIRERDVLGLAAWLRQAESSGLGPFRALSRGFHQDYRAIRAALSTPFSTAQCEGQVCRLKLIKRLGYGRAKPDLLRQRVLHRLVAVDG